MLCGFKLTKVFCEQRAGTLHLTVPPVPALFNTSVEMLHTIFSEGRKPTDLCSEAAIVAQRSTWSQFDYNAPLARSNKHQSVKQRLK